MSTVASYPVAAWRKPAASGMLCLLLVFLAGVAVGGLAMSLGVHDYIHSRMFPASFTLDRWKKELNLSKEQCDQIEIVLDDFSKYYDNVLADGNSRIRAILNEEQRIKFDRLLKEHR